VVRDVRVRPISSEHSFWLSSQGRKVLRYEGKHIAQGTNPFIPKPPLIPKRQRGKSKVVKKVKKERNAKMRIGIQLKMSKEAFKKIEKMGQ
jgi:hypothetical protein